MNQDFECTKIKDGLYLGNIVAAHDYEFLISNKFGYVVNCTAEIPNVFQHQNIRYLKFKLIQNKPHKLWDQTLKKLNKLEKFLEQAEQTSLCCLIHSFHGQNRSLVFIVGYLMKKYQWRLKKTLQFLKSKQIFIGLSNHYITQLEILQEILLKNSILSSAWTPPYINEEQEIISKTYVNSLEGKQIKSDVKDSKNQSLQEGEVKKKNERRIVWLDKLQKKKKKEEISQKKAEQLAKVKQKTSTHIETVKYHIPEYDMRDPELLKNLEFNSNKRLNSSQSLKPKDALKNQKNIVVFEQPTEQKSQVPPPQKNIYQLTINNFISPNFNIINKTEPMGKKTKKKDQEKSRKQENLKKDDKSQNIKDKEKKPRPTSGNKKSTQKINRAQSEKQVATVKGLKEVNEYENMLQNKQVKQNKEQKEKEKKVNIGGKERDVKKELKKELEKVEKEKTSHSSLHLLHPLSTLAQQLIKTQQQGAGKRSSTPTRKERRKEVTR